MKKLDNVKIAEELVKIAKDLIAGREEKLVALIDERGKIVEAPGIAIEGVGIYDESEDEEYAGGFDKKGVAWGSMVDDDDTILLLNGNRSKYKVDKKYRV